MEPTKGYWWAKHKCADKPEPVYVADGCFYITGCEMMHGLDDPDWTFLTPIPEYEESEAP